MCREHNDANVMAFGARVIGIEVAKQMVKVFLTTKFNSGHENHPRRVQQINDLDEK